MGIRIPLAEVSVPSVGDGGCGLPQFMPFGYNDGCMGVVTYGLFACLCSGSSFLTFSTFRLPGSFERHSEPVRRLVWESVFPLLKSRFPALGTGDADCHVALLLAMTDEGGWTSTFFSSASVPVVSFCFFNIQTSRIL